MNWKKLFEQKVKPLADMEVRDGKWLVEQDETINFISTEIIEKLIADQSSLFSTSCNCVPCLVNKKTNQQLRDKWL